jgi:hypothetical protein
VISLPRYSRAKSGSSVHVKEVELSVLKPFSNDNQHWNGILWPEMWRDTNNEEQLEGLPESEDAQHLML